MRAFRASLFVVLVASLFAPLARAAGYAELGTLERGAVDAALAARGLTIDPAPAGKIIGTIHVVNLEVFQPGDGGFLEWFNHFHRTTREDHVRRESLLASGTPYDPAWADETVRNLRNQSVYDSNDTGLSSVVAIVPIQAAVPGTVDLLMVTRDLWSLRFNSDWSFEPITGYLYTLNASLSENNLFGWRKQVALVFLMDPGEMRLGPNYIDPNVLGTRLRLSAAFYEIWARQLGQIAAGPREGSAALVRLEYPLYALSRRWGAFVEGSYTDNVTRTGSGKSLTRYDPNSIDLPCVVPGGLHAPRVAHPTGHPGKCLRPAAADVLARLSIRSRATCKLRTEVFRGLRAIFLALPAVRCIHAPLPHVSQPRHLRFGRGQTARAIDHVAGRAGHHVARLRTGFLSLAGRSPCQRCALRRLSEYRGFLGRTKIRVRISRRADLRTGFSRFARPGPRSSGCSFRHRWLHGQQRPPRRHLRGRDRRNARLPGERVLRSRLLPCPPGTALHGPAHGIPAGWRPRLRGRWARGDEPEGAGFL